jgi:hypothetical protein
MIKSVQNKNMNEDNCDTRSESSFSKEFDDVFEDSNAEDEDDEVSTAADNDEDEELRGDVFCSYKHKNGNTYCSARVIESTKFCSSHQPKPAKKSNKKSKKPIVEESKEPIVEESKEPAKKSNKKSKKPIVEDSKEPAEEEKPKKKSKKSKGDESKEEVQVNLTNLIIENLTAILTEQLKSKYASKAIKILTSKETQSLLENIIQTNTNTKTTKKKNKKDPNKPKNALSGYNYFCKQNRTKISEQHPDLKGTDIMIELGKSWRAQTDKDKKPYQKLSEKDKKRYQDEMKDYVPSPEYAKTKKSKKKPSNKPKRGCSAYIFFYKDKHAEIKAQNTDMTSKEIREEIGRVWREEYKGSKKANVYVKEASEDKERYTEEMKNYSEQDKDEDNEDDKEDDDEEIQTRSKKKSKKKGSSSTKGGKNASQFSKYMKKNKKVIKEAHPDYTPEMIVDQLQKIWDEYTDEEKAKYNK